MNKPVAFREQARELLRRISEEPRNAIQALCGPRQVGKTTITDQVAEHSRLAAHFASADTPLYRRPEWLALQWRTAREKASAHEASGGALLVLDEIQNVPHWAEYIKQYWDEDTRSGCPLRVIVSGSSPMLLQRGLSAVLAGRVDIIDVPHWSFSEMRDVFDMSLEKYLFYGGYPGAVKYMSDPDRWRRYILNTAIGPALERDLPDNGHTYRRTLLRMLVELGCGMSGSLVSHSKLIGLLANGGEIAEVATCLLLTQDAGLLCGLQKYTRPPVRARRSVPKLQVFNNALFTAMSSETYESAIANPEYWGHLAESAVGAHLINAAATQGYDVRYWREEGFEVDFVIAYGTHLLAIEVKTGRKHPRLPGLGRFLKRFPHAQVLPVLGSRPPDPEAGGLLEERKPQRVNVEGMLLDEFLASPVEKLLKG